ncbi:MAG TPA: DUF6295 family protein [Acidimicrobiales bacterium]|jgi:hypothetical protein|nr:DUF6295 family protein [Acidimicrobiales bacterium]
MCTYTTIRAGIRGSAKGPAGQWMRVSDLTVYFDHPVHALEEHTVNIDVADPSRGPSGRVALELSPASARTLAEAITTALASAPAELTV